MNIPAIPTHYKGIRFRSRLEAKWAVFFDLCGWDWHYEPFDANGWIPDFVIVGKRGPILVEIKPTAFFQAAVAEKAERAVVGTPWYGNELLLLGLGPFRLRTPYGSVGDYRMLGWLGEAWPDPQQPEWNWAEAPLGVWTANHGFCHSESSYGDRISGEHTGNWGHESGDAIDRMWGSASNTAQWKAPA